ncbi:unnamed protein product [Effrenium voratum]|nr:unnamed protein product [Effrenium voratum]
MDWAALVYLRAAGICTIFAMLMAFVGLAYACYLEYVYENLGIARAFQSELQESEGCLWRCMVFVGQLVHSVGFYVLIAAQDFASIMLVLVSLLMVFVGDFQLGMGSICGATPLLSDDQTCTETIANVSSFVGRDLLNGKVSCSNAGVLMCEGVVASENLVRFTMIAAAVGAAASCCIPRRLIALSLSAEQSIKTAQALVAGKTQESA